MSCDNDDLMYSDEGIPPWTIGSELAWIRRRRKVSLEKLSFETEISQKRLEEIEQNKAEITINELISIADFYNISLDTIARPDYGPPPECILRNLDFSKCPCKRLVSFRDK